MRELYDSVVEAQQALLTRVVRAAGYISEMEKRSVFENCAVQVGLVWFEVVQRPRFGGKYGIIEVPNGS